ncbi:glutamate-rich protein 3 isoform X2 [Triplophysa rosa]|uniref:Glutamate-rich protein 3 n=1 Tax=Triplophysa rosa TaxID=992332 RepID=A0A9W7TG43_TRIRA|nr:glutamate-rich protein 3 isoform X2 [Triplophysa rosa]KAI7798043.1 putative glutamate-rich protein 3 [Triplophysa rosa]
MSHLNPGLIAAYNSLTDRHLTGYFNNVRIRRHLQKVGLITRSGRIVPDKEYKHKMIQRAHQRHVRECLAQAIFHKVLDMERLHQSEIKRKLEEFARREQMNKTKTERSRRCDEEPMLMLSPRPPTRPKISHARHSGPEGENSESTESPNSSRPNTAPGNIQRPVRLKPLNSNSATASLRRTSPRHRLRERDSSNDTDQPLRYMLDRDTMRHTTMTDFSSTISPYSLPVINNYVTPVPPLTKKKDRGTRANGTHRGRKLRPTTAPTEPPSALQRTSAQSMVSVRMVYFGKSVHLSHDLMDLRDEVKVFQQHCGGENLCVFKGKLTEGETFQLVSRRHQGFPFSLTFFLNGLQVERLSSCCEFKHRKGSRLGGRHGHFGFCSVEGASPCYKCIIAMGLDKKPTPPVKRVKEEPATSKSPDEEETTDVDEDIETHSNTEPRASQGMETDHNGVTAEQKKRKDDYEEDFEADDKGPVEDAEDAVEKPSSVANDEVKETESRDEHDQSENNKESDSEVEEASTSKVQRSPSVSSGRTSSLSSRDSDNSEREIEDDTKEVTTAVLEQSFDVQPEEDLTTKMEESSSVTVPQEEDSETQDSPLEKSELEMSVDIEKNERTEGEEVGEEAKPDDIPQEPESERATSIQEKLTEAILKESQCSSEAELSDTSTEEDEGASVKTQQGAERENAVGFTSPQPPNTQEDIQEENETNTHEAACETSHGDDETGQPEKEETNTQMPHAQKDEDEEKQSIKNEEVTANLDEKQEIKELERTNEVEQQDEQIEVQIETEANINSDSQDIQEEVKDEDKEEPQTHDQTLNTENTGHEDTPAIESELPEVAEEPAIEKEGSVSHTENDKETGVADTERKADDADQSNERPDGDERDDLTDEAGDDGSTGEKIQDTDDVMDDAGSVIKLEGEEKSSEEKGDSAEEDVKDEEEKEEEDKVIVEEIAEKEGEDESKDLGDAGKAIEGEEENKGVEDLKSEDKDKERIERDDREESGEVELQENKEDQDMKADDTENDNDVEIEKVDVHEGQNESEDGEQGRNEISEDEGPKSENEVVEETEKVNSEMMENREQEENENEVEEGNRDEMAEREGEGMTENLTFEEEESKKEEDINEIGENVDEKDENKEVMSHENVTEKPEDNVTGDQNEELVLQEEQNEKGYKYYSKNNDLSGDVDAENGETENARKEDVEKQEDEEMQDKLDGETTAGPAQDVTDDSEAKPEINEDVREDAEVHSEKVVDDKSMTEEADKESETSAKTFIENIVPEEMETTNKIPEVEGTTEEHNDMEKEPKDADMRSRDAPEGKDSEPGEPLENSVKEEEDRSMSHSVKSQPAENVFKNEEKNLSIDSEEPAIRPAVLDKAAGVDLVSNWINIHQASRYFQTFIEPVDEIKESSISDETEKDRNGEVLDVTDTQSTDEIATPVQSDLNENTGHDTVVESFITEKKPEDLEDNITQEEKVKEGGDNRGSLVTKWSRQSHDDGEIDRREDSSLNNVAKVQDLASELNPNSQEESEQKKQQTTTEEITQLSSVSQTEETIDKEILDTSEHNVKSEHEYIEAQSPTITVITDLTIVNKSENGSQDDTASVDVRSKQSDGNRRTKVIDGHFKQSVNDTLSTFSLDDSRFFGPAGYPRLTTAHTENSY